MAAFLVSARKKVHVLRDRDEVAREKKLNKIVIWMVFVSVHGVKRRSTVCVYVFVCLRVFVADAIAVKHVNDFQNDFSSISTLRVTNAIPPKPSTIESTNTKVNVL